jgi:hypothetical protein
MIVIEIVVCGAEGRECLGFCLFTRGVNRKDLLPLLCEGAHFDEL